MTPLSDEPLKEVRPEFEKTLADALIGYGLTTAGPQTAAQRLVKDLASELYRFHAGGHHERSGYVQDLFDGAMAAWEEELEEARNQRAYDDEGVEDE